MAAIVTGDTGTGDTLAWITNRRHDLIDNCWRRLL